jgi:formate dehydrogenase major subunit
MPYHWGSSGLTTGDTVNDLTAIALDPNVGIQEDKALTVDIRPGRRPHGPGRVELVREYQRRAGVTADTGLER